MRRPPLQYFFPKATEIPPALTPRFELACTRSNVGAMGPSGKGLLAAPYTGVYPTYDAASQRWTAFGLPDGGKYWIGIEKTATSIDFQREVEILPGQLVELAHGWWTIPIANPLVDTCRLPFWEMPDGQGGWTRQVKDQFREMSEYAMQIAGILREVAPDGDDTVGFILDEDEIRDMIVRIIAINYDLTKEEMGALHLFDPATYGELVMTFCDYPAMIRMMREKLEEANAPLNPTEATPGGNSIGSGGKVSSLPVSAPVDITPRSSTPGLSHSQPINE